MDDEEMEEIVDQDMVQINIIIFVCLFIYFII